LGVTKLVNGFQNGCFAEELLSLLRKIGAFA
jgi:hypothetical protein